MSLVFCPECGHEISSSAVACPNCGHPLAKIPVVDKKVVVVPPPSREGFPTWAFIPIGAVAIALIFILFAALRSDDDAANTNVSVATRRSASEPVREIRTTEIPSTDVPRVSVPPSQTTSVPGTTTVAPVLPPPEKGTVIISARVSQRSGSPQAARNAKFYLLDKDVLTILNDAHVEPIEGNDLMSSLGLATVYPSRYGDFLRSAMRAIASHSKYAGTTDVAGSANLRDIAPKEYYLFGITKIGQGFALWNSPVSVIAGQNKLDLSPESVTEIPDTSG